MIAKNQMENNLLWFHGPINVDLVSFMSNYIKQHIKATGQVTSKIYKVLIELMQNVSYYSANQSSDLRSFGSGIGWCRVDENETEFSISTGNIILKEHAPVLQNNIKEINNMDDTELRELKRKTRSQACIRDIGAHIGLIQMAVITGNTLDINFDTYDEKHSLFSIVAKVNKK